MNKNILFIAIPLLIGGAIYLFTVDNSDSTTDKRETISKIKSNQTQNQIEREEKHADKKIDKPIKISSFKELIDDKSQKNPDMELLKKEVVYSDSEQEKEKELTLLNETTQEIRAEINERILTEMQNLPECLEGAKTKEDAFECSNNLRNMQRELSVLQGDSEVIEIEAYDETFVWNEETKKMMISGLKESLTQMQQTNYCMEKRRSSKELAECLEIGD